MISSADREQKDAGGQMAYLRGLWEAITQNEVQELIVTFDDEEPVTITTPSFVIANAAPLTTALAQGGDEPDMTDGKLDITWLQPQEQADQQFLSLAELVFSNHDYKKQSERLEHRQVKKVAVEFKEKSDYALDGEILQAQKITVETKPASLTVFNYRQPE